MNDPGLDGPIAQDAKDVDGENKREKEDEEEMREEDEQEFLAPTRWWFASTAFPLIAGTFGPMASAFSICALVVHWRVRIPPGGVEEHGIYLDDPKWLIAVNACQLAIAIISNLFLLLNMAQRVRFSVAQPITIIGWYISSFTLVGLTATASGPLRLPSPPDHAFTQAFYYGIFSAGIYFIVASLMVVTVIGTHLGHYSREFKLTMSQRTLMLQTIMFLVYLLVGATVYAHIEAWDFLDAVYWADFTLLTVGIGDYAPKTHLGRSLLFPFAIVGIIIIGLVIGSIRSLVLERGKLKLGARMVEKERRRILKALEKEEDNQILHPIHSEISGASSQNLAMEKEIRTERRRREMEFNLMRDTQEKAATRRRWMSLSVSGLVWLILWFGGAAIFQQTERNQHWSYFQSLYFAYTSLLTIGYGDLFPMSNSGKPFFVFWSLLAVPSLTILISNMGDTIVKFIRDITLRIGRLTVLPDEQGIRSEIKTNIYKLSKGRAFSNFMGAEEEPPGILGESNRHANASNPHARKNDPESAAQKGLADQTEKEERDAGKRGETNDRDAKPESRRHYHLMLAQEIIKVMKHLNSSPPRKYTFDEWAWFLKLIGEDESDAKTHRKPVRNPKGDAKKLQSAVGDGGAGGAGVGSGKGEGADKEERKGDQDKRGQKLVKWSWMGNRSPLMGNKEEAEWLLERLTRTLERELDEMRREELDGEGEGEKEDGQSEEGRSE